MRFVLFVFVFDTKLAILSQDVNIWFSFLFINKIMRFCRFFSLFKLHTYTKTSFYFRKYESISFVKSRAHYIENKWLKVDEYIIAIIEHEWEGMM